METVGILVVLFTGLAILAVFIWFLRSKPSNVAVMAFVAGLIAGHAIASKIVEEHQFDKEKWNAGG